MTQAASPTVASANAANAALTANALRMIFKTGSCLTMRRSGSLS
jgi:hypothetical protein